MTATPWLDVLDETIRSCATHDRPDLVRRLRVRRAELAGPKVRVLVLGESGQGKSQLLNGLLGSTVCAVGDDVTTTVPAVLQHASGPTASLLSDPRSGGAATSGDPTAGASRTASDPAFRPVPADDRLPAPYTGPSSVAARSGAPASRTGSRLPIPAGWHSVGTPLDSLVLEGPALADPPSEEAAQRTPVDVDAATAEANRRADVRRVEIGLPRKLLESGLTLIDTPPVGPDASAAEHTRAALSMVPQADAVLLITDVTREPSEPECDLATQVFALCPNAAVVFTKTDLVPEWERIAERTRARLASRGMPATVFGVSASLRMVAAESNDADLNQESGYPALISYLHKDLMGNIAQVRKRSVGALSRLALERLVVPLRERLTEVQQGGNEELSAKYRAASQKLEEVQRESSRWQTMLSDEVADLNADLDYDLRDRTRRILREADEYFDTADPVKDWPEFEQWLRENLRTAAEANSTWLLDRFEYIAHRLAAAIMPRDPGLFASDAVLTDVPREEIEDLKMPTVEKFTVGQKLFTGMRGSYGGLLMFGLATSLAGMELINPISISAGVAFGAKSVLEERETRLKRRQATARTAAHRHVDDFFLAYGKQSKDTVRLIQRELRDRCNAVAQELRTEISDTAQRIKQVMENETAERNTAARQLAKRIEELEVLRRRADALAPKSPVRELSA
ncbi:P-loop NTPase family protein [Saccharomonospora iraqiensis]|uniref:GTP-binding protein n=1 Tax=Saccharomonospora iraqiensis TaxID=52698 RepID=UPI00022DF161|nr:GTP-binding protein [Saccharomonospora iraqiensis]